MPYSRAIVKLMPDQLPTFLAMLERIGDVPNTTYPPGVATVTGRVPLLPGVQVPCLSCRETGWVLDQLGLPMGKVGLGNDKCPKCCGLGWMPSKDLAVWLDLLPDSEMKHREPNCGLGKWTHMIASVHGFGVGMSWLEAAVDNMRIKLRPLACNVAEAEAWVKEKTNEQQVW